MGSYLLYEEERAREEVYTLLSRQAVLNAQAIQRKVSPDELRRETVKVNSSEERALSIRSGVCDAVQGSRERMLGRIPMTSIRMAYLRRL